MPPQDPYQPVIPGTAVGPRSARTENGIRKAGQDYSRRKFGDLGTGPGGAAVFPSNTITVKNVTGGDLAASSVLVQGAALVDPATLPQQVQASPFFEAAAVSDITAPFVITTQAIRNGATGEAVVSGLAVVSVVISDASHTRAVPVASTTGHLISAASGGVPLWWTPGGTGTKNCLVMLGPNQYDPDASTSVRGYMNTTTQSLAGAKTFTTSITTPVVNFGTNNIADTGSNTITISSGVPGEIILNSLSLLLDITNLFITGGLTGQTTNVTISGTTLHFTNGILTSVT